METRRYEILARNAFKACLEVHKAMGHGLLESVYRIKNTKKIK